MNRIAIAAFVVAAGLAVPAAAQVEGTSGVGLQRSLTAAKDLYSSARYDEALQVLDALRAGGHADRKSIEQYRSLCLLALGRTAEAETAIAAVTTADPTYRPAESDASPRVRAAFTDVRRRLLPDIAAARYRTAKATYDRKEWAEAEQQFALVLSLIDDPDCGGRLGDLRDLTVGFLELSARAAAPPPPALPPAEPKPAAAPVASDAGTTPSPAPAPETSAIPAGPAAGKVYTADDSSVAAPVVLRQEIPAVPASLIAVARPKGLMEIVIDEQGRVISMAVRSSIHPNYDTQLLAAARDWKYKPATFDGQPVRFRRLIQVNLKR